MKNKPIKQKYPVLIFNTDSKPYKFKRVEYVEDEKIIIKGFEDYSFIVHKDCVFPWGWNVTEEETSSLISYGGASKRAAITDAKRLLKEQGKNGLDFALKSWKEKYGCVQDYLDREKVVES